jgi:type II secretion system protein H
MIRHRAQGFTLIEISVVTVIIAMMAVLVLPKLAVSKREDEFRKSFQKIESIANNSRDLAVSSGRTYVLTWDAENSTLTSAPTDSEEQGSQTAQPDDSSATQQEQRTAALGKDWSLTEVTSGQDESKNDTLELRFFSDGSAQSRNAKFLADDVEIHLDVTSLGAVKVTRGASDRATVPEWEAGDLEERTQ